MIDDLGKAKGLGPIKAAALFYDRRGRLAGCGKTGLAKQFFSYKLVFS
jgi:hypothetical protein